MKHSARGIGPKQSSRIVSKLCQISRQTLAKKVSYGDALTPIDVAEVVDSELRWWDLVCVSTRERVDFQACSYLLYGKGVSSVIGKASVSPRRATAPPRSMTPGDALPSSVIPVVSTDLIRETQASRTIAEGGKVVQGR